MPTLLYLTDLYYEANGRNYYEEDLYITSKLKKHFNVLIGHPQQAMEYMECADFMVFRNTGPVVAYQEYFDRFVALVKEKNIPSFNSFDGKADMKGKQYLLDLYKIGYPVIPVIEDISQLATLNHSGNYIVKLKNGADSIGMEELTKEEILEANPKNKLIQPFINFQYEVSFYYLNNVFQYALYAPEKDKRWDLQEYAANQEDLAFADRFIEWNNMQRGITRVDACRLQNGSLLLVELEDLNPFLSLDALTEIKRNEFMQHFTHALLEIK